MARFLQVLFSTIAGSALALSGCAQNGGQTAQAPTPAPTASLPLISPSPAATSQPQPQQDYFADAVEKANRATELSKGAISNDDWSLVVRVWQQSINLLKQVPKTSANYVQAQAKLKSYSAALATATANTNRSTKLPPPQTIEPPDPPQSQPVRTVAAQPQNTPAPMSLQQFLEQIYFEEVINRGGSGGSLWCAQSEDITTTLFAPRSYSILDVHTAPNGSGGSVTARVNSSNKGGQPIIANWLFVVKKAQTVGERNYKELNSPVSAKAYRDFVGGWCLSLILER